MAILKRVNGEPAGQVIELKSELTVIGRAPECQIILDPNGVSRKHAQIRKVGDTHVLADLNSRNKTLLNTVELKAGNDQTLKPGDRINICDVEFIYYLVPPKESAPKGPSNVMLVTGPSRSADIEQTLELGAHGPQALLQNVIGGRQRTELFGPEERGGRYRFQREG